LQNVVRKIERQYAELSDEKNQGLRVNETAVEAYLKKFQWDFASYQSAGKQLAELVSQIQALAGKSEEELKLLSTNYTDKNLALAAAKRRQIINLVTSDFEDFLTPEKIAKLDVQNSEHLITVMVVVPKSLEQGKYVKLFTSTHEC
jgi:membrane-bound ClpP family serine protease